MLLNSYYDEKFLLLLVSKAACKRSNPSSWSFAVSFRLMRMSSRTKCRLSTNRVSSRHSRSRKWTWSLVRWQFWTDKKVRHWKVLLHSFIKRKFHKVALHIHELLIRDAKISYREADVMVLMFLIWQAVTQFKTMGDVLVEVHLGFVRPEQKKKPEIQQITAALFVCSS